MRPQSGVITNARPKRLAYVNLPRKYSPLMWAKRSPIGTPASDRSCAATGNAAFGESTCLARSPRQFAGESRNSREDIFIWYSDCFGNMAVRPAVRSLLLVCLVAMPQAAFGYGVLAHEAIVD